MNYPENIEQKLGFTAVRAHVAALCDNNLGKEKCRTMAFTTNYNLIRTLIGQVNEYKTILNRGEAMPNGAVFDLREELERTRVAGTYLTESELLNLGKTLRSAIEIHDFFTDERRRAYPELWRLAESLSLFPDVVATIDRTLDRFGGKTTLHHVLSLLPEYTSTAGVILRARPEREIAVKNSGGVEIYLNRLPIKPGAEDILRKGGQLKVCPDGMNIAIYLTYI